MRPTIRMAFPAILASLLLLPAACSTTAVDRGGRPAPGPSGGRWELGLAEESGEGAVPVVVTASMPTVEPGMPRERTPDAMRDETHEEMLASAVARGLIDAADVDSFHRVHELLDAQGPMDEAPGVQPGDELEKERQRSRTDAAVAAGLLSPEDAEAFTRIHDILVDSGLMRGP